MNSINLELFETESVGNAKFYGQGVYLCVYGTLRNFDPIRGTIGVNGNVQNTIQI